MPEHGGWHSRGYLPHFDEPGLVQSVNFRLFDSLPKTKLLELEALLPKERVAERRQQIEAWLDRGAGSCLLRNHSCAAIVEQCLLHHDGAKYHALAWSIMPNHVHFVLYILPGYPLDQSLHGIKLFSAKGINRHLARSGPLWRPEYFDRYIRDEDHFRMR